MTPPRPMPTAAASPSRLLSATATRATSTKLGPGLTTPTASAPRIAATAMKASADTGSVHLQVLHPHHAVGHGAQARELRRVGPQPIAVEDIDDRPVLLGDGGDLLVGFDPLLGIELGARFLDQLVHLRRAV